MSRGLVLNLLASALTILAAIALLGATAFVGEGRGSLAATDQPRSAAVVHRFYDAVNATLRTGDAAPLNAILAPGLVVHRAAEESQAGRAKFLSSLNTLRAHVPGLRLSVEAVSAVGTRAVARVTPAGGSPAFLGLRLLTPTASWSSHDAFRIENGQIAELWTDVLLPIKIDPLAQGSLDLSTSTARSLSLERIEAPPGTAWRLGPFVDPRVICVASGAMAVEAYPGSRWAIVAGAPRREPTGAATVTELERGDAAALPLGSLATIHQSRTSRGVTAFAVVASRFDHDVGTDDPAKPRRRDDVQGSPADAATVSTTLVRASVPNLPDDAMVSCGRASLDPGQTLAFAAADGPVFVVAETGSIVLQGEGHPPRVQLLDRGAAESVMPGTPVALVNLGHEPASVVVVTALPATAVGESTSPPR